MNGRPPTLEDVPRLVEFMNVVAVDDGTGFVDDEELRHWLTSANHDVQDDFRIFEEDAEPLAYADVGLFGGGAWLDARVRPDLRGSPLEEEVLAWGMNRARELAPSLGVVRRSVASTDAAGHAASLRAGFRPTSHSFRMRIELTDRPRWAIPEGIVLRDFREGEERAIWAAHQESFADTEGRTEDEPFDEWYEDRLELGAADPSLWIVAGAEGEIAGLCLCRFREGGGWVGVLGVRIPWRGRGLGTALLLEAFGRFWDRGERVVGLGVDGRSPNAVRLYERAGMCVYHRWDAFEAVL